MSEFTRAIGNLLQLDGKTVPESWNPTALLEAVGQSPWLRFALGVPDQAPVPADLDGLTRAAVEFATHWELWEAYRLCVLAIAPPGAPVVKFVIDPAAAPRAQPPQSFPASTFAIITAWNPGSGEPRPNAKANERANARLAAHLDARMVERWPAENAPGSRWREESFCVLGIDLDEAWRIGEAFQQRAIYYVDQGRPLLVSRRRGNVVSWAGEIRVL